MYIVFLSLFTGHFLHLHLTIMSHMELGTQCIVLCTQGCHLKSAY